MAGLGNERSKDVSGIGEVRACARSVCGELVAKCLRHLVGEPDTPHMHKHRGIEGLAYLTIVESKPSGNLYPDQARTERVTGWKSVSKVRHQ